MKKTRERYKLIKMMKKNHGTAIILSLVVVSVLFILTSFLVRKVVTNTTMVEKAGEEQKSYALAKQGILYALDQLNTWDGADPDYDPTDWPETGNKNWIELDLDDKDEDNDVTTGDKECRVRVDKDDLPPNVFVSPDPNDNSNYITIESQELPKKLVNLQAITKNTSPLLDYVRFINSDTIFGDQTFGDPNDDDYLIQGDAPLCILGNVTWESGSSNNLTLSNSDSKALIYGNISNGGVDELKINGNNAKQGYYYFFDPDDPSYNDPDLFDTDEGHYFSLVHLPSCYDYSEPGSSPAYYYGGPQSASWPEIEETRYQNLASGTNCYLNNPGEVNLETEWSDPLRDNNTSYDNDMEYEWFQDTAGSTSWHYYPYAPRLVLNTTNISQKLSDGAVNTIDYSDITNNIIYAEGDISVSGIIPDGKQLTFVSGGNIFIDSNLLKKTNDASLALLAKKSIVLNPTLRYAVEVASVSPEEPWQNNPSAALANPDDVWTYPGTGIISIPSGITNTYIIDLDLGRLITGGRIVLWNYEEGGSPQVITEVDIRLSRQDLPPYYPADWDFAILGLDPPDGDYHIDFTPQTFRWVRLELRVENTNPNPQNFTLSSEGFDAIEVPIYAVDAALFTEDGTLEVVTGGGVAQDESILPNNNAYQPESTEPRTPSDSGSYSQRLFFWGTLAEPEWTGNIPGWEYIAYAYDDNLSLNPPPSLPPSVNLVSLKRK